MAGHDRQNKNEKSSLFFFLDSVHGQLLLLASNQPQHPCDKIFLKTIKTAKPANPFVSYLRISPRHSHKVSKKPNGNELLASFKMPISACLVCCREFVTLLIQKRRRKAYLVAAKDGRRALEKLAKVVQLLPLLLLLLPDTSQSGRQVMDVRSKVLDRLESVLKVAGKNKKKNWRTR